MVRRFSITAVILVLFLSSTSAAIDVFPLDEVRPGMRGSGKTVVRGTNVETFDVEVIGVVPQNPPTPSLVMISVSGDVIDLSGGIAAGMSGSPVYIDEKLLGAIGYGYAFTDHRVGLVTPAGRMLELMDGIPETSAALDLPDGAREVKTPLLVGGIDGRAFRFLEEQLGSYSIKMIPNMAGTMGTERQPLEPGSAFGVQLMRGDFQAASFGTVTHVEGERFVGFGHPFLHKGKVNYFVTPAQIHYTMPNLEFPFKVASSGPTIGSLHQDRAAGVAGDFNSVPDYLPIQIDVLDQDRSVSRSYRVETVRDDDLIAALGTSSAYQSIDAVLDRIGRGTAYVRLEIAAEGLEQPLIRENMYYSDSDIAVWSVYDLIDGLDLLLFNRIRDAGVSEVKFDVSVQEQRRTASIEKAVPRRFEVTAGDSVEVEVVIRPYRGPVESRIMRVEIPEDTLPGYLTVTMRPGGYYYYTAVPDLHTTADDEPHEDEESRYPQTVTDGLDRLVEEFVNRERNNEIIAEFYPFIDRFPPAEEDTYQENDEGDYPFADEPMFEPESASLVVPLFQFEWDQESGEPKRVRLTTQYVMEGTASFDLEVLER